MLHLFFYCSKTVRNLIMTQNLERETTESDRLHDILKIWIYRLVLSPNSFSLSAKVPTIGCLAHCLLLLPYLCQTFFVYTNAPCYQIKLQTNYLKVFCCAMTIEKTFLATNEQTKILTQYVGLKFNRILFIPSVLE